MLSKFRKHLSYANVMASLAVFAVLGGAAFAAVKLPKNSVGKKQIKANAVVTKKVKNGAITTEKLGDGAVTTVKLADGSVTTAKLADNAATGAKVDESTLGQVPSAASADSAQNATNAQNAANAANAQNAANANVAAFLGEAGFGIPQIRSAGANASNGTAVDLTPNGVALPVISRTVTVPTGGAKVVATGTLNLKTDAATASESSCQMQATNGGGNITRTVEVDFPATAEYNVAIPLSGFADLTAGDTTVSVVCATVSGNTSYVEGDLNVTVIPDE